jgi:hypothetical protein
MTESKKLSATLHRLLFPQSAASKQSADAFVATNGSGSAGNPYDTNSQKLNEINMYIEKTIASYEAWCKNDDKRNDDDNRDNGPAVNFNHSKKKKH